jgi:Holliday junction resolvase RusA-like endonuclease
MKVEVSYPNEIAPNLKESNPSTTTTIYIIEGVPAAYVRCKEGLRYWDEQHHKRMSAQNVLTDQRGFRPLFKGMLHLDINFYFPQKRYPATMRKKGLEGKPYGSKPALFNLINFIEIIGPDSLWTKDSTITSIKTTKVYDNNPRTEILIMELK